MIAVLVGCRAQRDVDGRDDVDVEADALLGEMRDKLRSLLDRREAATEPKALYLALVKQLAEVYRTVPEGRKPALPDVGGADWQVYTARVVDVLSGIEGASSTKIKEWCLGRDQIARPRNYNSPTHHAGGPVEAARAAVADVLGISARTLVHWERRDKVRPNADSIMAPRDALLYGDAVHFPDAIADIVELLALDDPEKNPELSAYVAALRARGFPRGPERTWLDDMVSTDEADEHE